MIDERRIEDDEIDLVELAKTIWRGRRMIALVVTLAVLTASAYLNVVDRKYTVSLVLKSAQEPSQPSGISGLGGIASLAGIELPSGSNADFSSFPLLMKSREVAEAIFDDEPLIQSIFWSEWDAEEGEWRPPSRSFLRAVLSPVKAAVTGSPTTDYVPPNAARLSEVIEATISASIDSKSDLLNVSTEASDPDLALSLMNRVVSETDALFRERFIKAGSAALEFYKGQLSRAQSGEHREALAQLIVKEEQKLMLATRSNSYVAEILRGPDISRMPTSPKPTLILALSFVLGLFAGAGLVLLRSVLAKQRSS